VKDRLHNLSQELKLAGASDSEANELAGIANNLKLLEQKSRNSRKIFVPIGLATSMGTIIGMALIIFSQTVLPGNWLYPVQQLSDNTAVSINSDYRGTVMMKRAQQVKQLIAEHADSSIVLATLADYQTEASAYKSDGTNYAVFEYCKSNLQQAATMAPSSERSAITDTLSSLQT
jgi:hypothetical protein